MRGSHSPLAKRIPARLRLTRALLRFHRDESGAMIYLALVVVLIMLFIGGTAVDLMRYEAQRTRIMSAADSAALAAASMRQVATPEEVVQNWFEAKNLSHALVGVQQDIGLNYRDVQVQTRAVSRNFFMHLLGIDELRSTHAGRAEERRTNVEIVLVLDLSGSMDSNLKLTRLKAAAVEFVENMLGEDQGDKVSISVVPYNGQVYIGPTLMAQYHITDRHDRSYCVDLPPTSYSRLAFSPTTPMPQHAAADTYNSSDTGSGWSRNNMAPGTSNIWCPNIPANTVRVLSNNIVQLRQQINALQAVGATSIDAGLRWGAALLDPSTRPVVSNLIRQGQISEAFEGRPSAYNDRETLKVLVLMTDGEHWPNEHVQDGYRSGPSPIYRHSDGNYSIFHDRRGETRNYYVPHKSAWYPHRWAGETCGRTSCTAIVPSGSGTPLDWQEVWQDLRVQWVANQLYRRPLGITLDAAISRLRNREGTVNSSGPHGVALMDGRLNTLCSLLKAQNVAVFGIAFEAPAGGANVIRNCVSPGRFYDVQGLDLREAFRSIRAQTQTLRLTQ
ncbi:pilus assembly protein TadG-related protein [Falsigemmobacter intermedius]|uniref:pilus assembly protein TadG-related protein n=1 Tax=Falsigemmobacter intermedius TaxID=1553448 RepID=UPI003F00C03C